MIKRIITISAVTILMLTATAGEREVKDERLSESNDRGTEEVSEEAGSGITGVAGEDISAGNGVIRTEVQTGTAVTEYGAIRPIPIKEEINNDRSSNGGNEDAGEATGSGETGSVQDGTLGAGTSGYTDPADDGLGAGGAEGEVYYSGDTEPASGDPKEPVSIPEGTDGDYAEELGDNGGYSGGDEGNQYEPVADSETDEGAEWEYYGNCRITFYCTGACCCGGNADGITASERPATPYWTVANGSLPFGTHVLIDGQEYCVEDRGVGGDQFDVLVGSHDEAMARGLYYTDVYVRW